MSRSTWMCESDEARFIRGKMPLLLSAVNDTAFGQVVRCQFDSHLVTRKNANVIFAHFSGNMGCHNMPVFEFYSKRRIRKSLVNDTFHLNCFFFRQGLRFSLVQKARELCRNGHVNATQQNVKYRVIVRRAGLFPATRRIESPSRTMSAIFP